MASWWQKGRWGLADQHPWAAPSLCSLPQAEAAGNLEVATLLQYLQTGADDLAPSSVSPPGRADCASEDLTPCG